MSYKLIALFQFLLALSGCSQSGTTISHRIQSNDESLDSTIHIQDGVARFECVDSSSGQCQYTLYPDACSGKPDCKLAPLQRFGVARGESRQLAGVVKFHPCVTTTTATLGADCKPVTTH
ncbi:hypothetical protein [Solilutibacter silvestris]|uniref:Lipoprotein n=1 Tax=Solilutibacter silvestris TaxID=1645665 RepID=A0A2K1Q1R1_9GAMM|nr:hypothetical protein [Lysobacter silvestris]PNS08972.1 hypothetical protein Lysil_0601 [Lysobacter silvestris]